MPDYKRMYFHMFNQITDALNALEERKYTLAESVLKQAQIDGEEAYISAEDPEEDEVVSD